MKQEFTGTDGEVGFISKWEGNKAVGTGEQEIINIINNESIESQLRFFKPWNSQSDAYLTVHKIDDRTTNVVWFFCELINLRPIFSFCFLIWEKRLVGTLKKA